MLRYSRLVSDQLGVLVPFLSSCSYNPNFRSLVRSLARSLARNASPILRASGAKEALLKGFSAKVASFYDEIHPPARLSTVYCRLAQTASSVLSNSANSSKEYYVSPFKIQAFHRSSRTLEKEYGLRLPAGG